jgi:hypothetical protein
LLAKHAYINNDHCRKADALTSIQNESYGNRLAELHIARLLSPTLETNNTP